MEQMQLQQMEQMQMEQNYQLQMEQNYQYQMQMGMEMWSMFAPGTQVVVDGLVHAASFNGLSGWIESFDAETNRYNVQLPMMDWVSKSGISAKKRLPLSIFSRAKWE